MSKLALSILLPILAIALSACRPAPPPKPPFDAKARIEAIVTQVMAMEGADQDVDIEERDKKAMQAIQNFADSLSDEELKAVAKEAHSDAKSRWIVVKVMLDRSKFRDAAHLVVPDALENPTDAQYRLWKWMEYTYGDRPDYRAFTRLFADGLLLEFENGSKQEKIAIASLFGEGPEAAALSTAEFKKAIEK